MLLWPQAKETMIGDLQSQLAGYQGMDQDMQRQQAIIDGLQKGLDQCKYTCFLLQIAIIAMWIDRPNTHPQAHGCRYEEV